MNKNVIYSTLIFNYIFDFSEKYPTALYQDINENSVEKFFVEKENININ